MGSIGARVSPIPVSQGPDVGLAWHYGDPFGEQRAMLDGRGWLDLSNREVVSVSGPDRSSWLHDLTTQSFTGTPTPSSATALVLEPTGRVRFWLRGSDDGQTWWGWTEPGQGHPLVDWLTSMRFLIQVDVQLHPELTVRWLGAHEPDADQQVIEVPAEVGVGREVLVPRGAGAPDARPVGQWAYEALRIAAGVPRIGVDTDHTTIPNELGLYGTVLDKGCYPGQETVARVHNVGRPPRRLVGLLLDGSSEQLPTPGAPLELDGREVGFVGSVAQHYELGPIGLGLVKRSVPIDAVLAAGGIPASQEVLVDPDVGLHVHG